MPPKEIKIVGTDKIVSNKVKNTINYTSEANLNALTDYNLIFGTIALSKNGLVKHKIITDKIKEEKKKQKEIEDINGPELHNLSDLNIKNIFEEMNKIKTKDTAKYNINIFTSGGPVSYLRRMLTKKEMVEISPEDFIKWYHINYGYDILGFSLTIF